MSKKTKKVTEAQIFLTRQCNLNCGYCNIVKGSRNAGEELSIEQWKSAFQKMDDFGIRTVKILGGEPTVKDWLPELLKYISEETSIKSAILSNSSFTKDFGERLFDAGLDCYFASVDYLAGYSDEKSAPGLKKLLELKDLGLEKLGANTVIMPSNVKIIPQLLESLTKMGIVMNLCPAHSGDNHAFEYRTEDKTATLAERNRQDLNELIIQLLDMKDDGYYLTVPSSYLLKMQDYAISLDWKCSDYSQLRIDADGDIKVCPDGGFLYPSHGDVEKKSEKYNILRMSKKDFSNLPSSFECNDWRKKCPGCGPWSAVYRAQENRRYAIGDPFVFEGRKNR